MAESEEELKSLLTREENKKADLKINIKKTKIMASGPITLWQIEREKVEAATNFIFLGFKTTANGECNHEIKTCSLEESYDKLESILKCRDVT